ncbi:MAG: thiosulfate oxidation carrier protein SoxY [Magnetococcales bacterium]|nr:thiosulfate oxidation carrier protein SoxY [Magnetococcales bacterium]MBF0156676.1 thiosulfate oxidation carrier protein SoxY [Magnetococcales bacterium]
MRQLKKLALTRRGFFRGAGLAGMAVLAAGTGVPRRASAEVDALVAEHMGAGPIAMEKVTLSAPPTAENGTLVRIPIEVDHPMEANNFIQSLGIFVDNNPSPFVAKFDFTPEVGKIGLELRIKMAKASKVRVICKSNTGKLFGTIKEISVAEGGCAG